MIIENRKEFTDLEKAKIAIAFNRVNLEGMTIAYDDVVSVTCDEEFADTIIIQHKRGYLSVVNLELMVSAIADIEIEIEAEIAQQDSNHKVYNSQPHKVEPLGRYFVKPSNYSDYQVFLDGYFLGVVEYIDLTDYLMCGDEVVTVQGDSYYSLGDSFQHPTLLGACDALAEISRERLAA